MGLLDLCLALRGRAISLLLICYYHDENYHAAPVESSSFQLCILSFFLKSAIVPLCGAIAFVRSDFFF